MMMSITFHSFDAKALHTALAAALRLGKTSDSMLCIRLIL